MDVGERTPRFSPATIAVVYAVIGWAWILFSDQIVSQLISDPVMETYVQTGKGGAFVAVSACVLFLLVAYSHRELAATTERLDLALQQTSILHRILRHNLRNSCNVIQGHARELRETEHAGHHAEVIEAETDALIEITAKTRLLRNVVLFESAPTESVDVADIVERSAQQARDRYPEATIRVSVPDTARVETHPDLAVAIGELLENAIEHHDGGSPTVEVAVNSIDPPRDRAQVGVPARTGAASTAPAGSNASGNGDHAGIEITIADDGPGIPEMEREVLQTGLERQTFHSIGIGLWLTRTIVTESGGEFRIDANEPRGTAVTIWLPDQSP